LSSIEIHSQLSPMVAADLLALPFTALPLLPIGEAIIGSAFELTPSQVSAKLEATPSAPIAVPVSQAIPEERYAPRVAAGANRAPGDGYAPRALAVHFTIGAGAYRPGEVEDYIELGATAVHRWRRIEAGGSILSGGSDLDWLTGTGFAISHRYIGAVGGLTAAPSAHTRLELLLESGPHRIRFEDASGIARDGWVPYAGARAGVSARAFSQRWRILSLWGFWRTDLASRTLERGGERIPVGTTYGIQLGWGLGFERWPRAHRSTAVR
jgi:hypothetical protein